MLTQLHQQRPTERGFSLIELMVGMAIGLITVLIIAQVALVYEGQKRTTTSGSDAQINGALALQRLQSEIQSAGFGLTSGGTIGCTEIRGHRNGVAYSRTMAPVVIVDGGGNVPDSLQILSSANAGVALPIRVYGAHRRADIDFNIDPNTALGTREGDLMMTMPTTDPAAGQASPTWCSLFSVSEVKNDKIEHHVKPTAPWNQDPTNTIFPGSIDADVSYAPGSFLVNLGTLIDRRFSIRDAAAGSAMRSLRLDNFDSTTGNTASTDLFGNIVNLQAVYGRDTNGDQQVDNWSATNPTTATEWAQVIAIRIALVARSDQAEKTNVDAPAPVWHPDGITAAPLPVDNVPDWQRYRYKIFEVVVPLRNMLWQS
jgi:type IV pilus assembly protein PilW